MINLIFWSIFSVGALFFILCIAAALGLPDTAMIITGGVLLMFSAAAAYIMSRRIVKPLFKIDLESPKNTDTYPEIQPLLSRISRQNELISRQMDDLRRQQREFRAITDNMSEGFILVDTSGSIISYNISAGRLMGLFRDAEKSVQDTFRECSDRAIKGQHNERAVSLGGKVYQLLANPVEVGGKVSGAVIVCLDITEKALSEQLRHDFSSNVSHELKTPLTSIYGISELMINGLVKPEDTASFAKNIHDESGRLITLINDIIKLSQLDDGSFTTEKSDVDIFRIAEDVTERLEPVAKERGISISLTGKPTVVNGIDAILGEMIYNLCDNAIKYNVENGKIDVSVTGESPHPVLTVSDTGIGIAHEDLDRVFERFYRVDKSHSKEIGGTGLGLSIVKHGAAYHGAEVSIKSEPGKGSVVTVTF